nr:hypothetical protein [Tanacetum cinerariifolium]
MPNLYVILKKEGFQNLSLTYLGGLWVLIETVSISAKEKLLNHTAFGPFICNDSDECESSNDEEDVKDDGSMSVDKVTKNYDVERVSESSCMHNNDLLNDNNYKNIMLDKDKVLSDNPSNLYDILNKRKDSVDDLKYPPDFTPSEINMEEVNKKVKGATRNKMESIELVTIKTLSGNSSFAYALSSSLGNSEDILCVWEPNLFVKDNAASFDNFLVVIDRWDGDCVIIGDFNEVETEQERYGLVFNVQGVNAFVEHLEEKHVSWARFGKKRDENTTHGLLVRGDGVRICCDIDRSKGRRRQK